VKGITQYRVWPKMAFETKSQCLNPPQIVGKYWPCPVPGGLGSRSQRPRLAELGIIGDNLTNRQRINRSTLSIVGYRLALETALSVCRLKTKSDDRQIELSVRTINRYSRMIV
jgi:hypothetical protein